MKYLYPYECERKGLSSPGELQAAIDSNRREGRRPSYSSSLFRFSPSPSTAPHILSPPKMHLSALGAGTSGSLNGLQVSPGPSLKKGRTHTVRNETYIVLYVQKMYVSCVSSWRGSILIFLLSIRYFLSSIKSSLFRGVYVSHISIYGIKISLTACLPSKISLRASKHHSSQKIDVCVTMKGGERCCLLWLDGG